MLVRSSFLTPVLLAACSLSASCGGDEPAAAVRDAGPPGDAALAADARDSAPLDGGTEGGPETTLAMLQNPSAAGHPTSGTSVALADDDLVALTPRTVIGDATGLMCRFGLGVGKMTGGDFTGLQLIETLPRGGALDCFAVPSGKIPIPVSVGDRLGAVAGTYVEFCADPEVPSDCRAFEQTQLLLGGAAGRTAWDGPGPPPTPVTVTVADLVNDAAGADGPRALALEGTLVRVDDVRVLQEISGPNMATRLVDATDGAAAKKLEVVIANFAHSACVRAYFAANEAMILASVTGILLPDDGRWKIRVRDEADVSGAACTS